MFLNKRCSLSIPQSSEKERKTKKRTKDCARAAPAVSLELLVLLGARRRRRSSLEEARGALGEVRGGRARVVRGGRLRGEEKLERRVAVRESEPKVGGKSGRREKEKETTTRVLRTMIESSHALFSQGWAARRSAPLRRREKQGRMDYGRAWEQKKGRNHQTTT